MANKMQLDYTQVKEIIWKEGPLSAVIENIQNHFGNKDTWPEGFQQEDFIRLKTDTRKFLSNKFNDNFIQKPVIASGHQPEFHHPGIVFKDLMAWKIASLINGVPLHIIVDTDQFELSYSYPVSSGNGHAELSRWHIVNENHRIYKDTTLSSGEKNALIEILEKQIEILPAFLESPDSGLSVLQELLVSLKSGQCIQKTNELIREKFFSERGIHLYGIYVSELASLPAFTKLVEVIRGRLPEFRSVYNNALAEYRALHRIKNHAQPIPDLALDEMPFWILDEENDIRKVMRSEDKTENKIIFPRAVTLTLFLRLFISDFFIHGKGGGRYEEVSEHILKEFFKIDPAPFEVASATMHLEPRPGFLLPEINDKDLESRIRDTVYSPEKFLDQNHELVVRKKQLQEMFKDPGINKKELNSKIQDLNEQIKLLIVPERERLENLKRKVPDLMKTRAVFSERTYPFYYYKMDELVDYVKNLK